jgi:hypothetical protein
LVITGGLVAEEATQTERQFWPEADVFWKASERIRFVLLASLTENRDTEYRNSEFGAFADVFVPRFGPILFRRISHHDDSRTHRITVRAGYRFVRTISAEPPSTEHRFQSDATMRWALPGEILMSDRHRGEYRIIDDQFSFRYRNELKIERDFAIRRIPISPYVSAEIFYDTRFDAFSRWRYTGGVALTLGDHTIIEPHYTRQIVKHPQFQVINAIGLTVNIYLH